MARRGCVVVDVDGVTVRVNGSGTLQPESLKALREIVRAVRQRVDPEMKSAPLVERPILFSAPMVRAILSGAKTQTRRIVKPQPHPDTYRWCSDAGGTGKWMALRPSVTGGTAQCWGWAPCPYGAPGDRLYVKEAAWMWCERRPNGTTKTGRPKWHYVPLRSAPIIFCADHPGKPGTSVVSPDTGNQWAWRKKLGRFLPKWASRITLEATGVRVERLQAISDADAEAEGVGYADSGCDGECGWDPCSLARVGFERLWKRINGAASWDANPWVWVVEFKRVEAR